MSKAFKIKDFPDYYVTDSGDVYSANYRQSGRIKRMVKCRCGGGYLNVCLRKDNKNYTRLIHRLVAEAFIPNPENKPQINHKNGDKTDNRVKNLEWVTASENEKHSYKVLHKKANKAGLGKFGKDSPSSKPVVQIKDGKIVGEYEGLMDAYRKTGINYRYISASCKNQNRSAGGFHWQYK